MLEAPFFNLLNIVSRGVFECHFGCCNHGALRNRRDFSCPNQFYFILYYFLFFSVLYIFYFLNLNIYLECAC